MEDGNTIRKLRAIMFSDIVGYSIMMQNNESEALKILQKHKEIVEDTAEKYGGKIIKYVGDEILVESESAVMLVYCAKELQKRLAERNASVPKSRELWVRIGIHIGDVIIKEDDIFGDGVNIAARIRPIAEPGGIVITHSVLILLGNQDDIRCSFVGNKKLKNIKEKTKVYEVMQVTGDRPVITHHANKLLGIKKEVLIKAVIPIFSVFILTLLTFLLIASNKITDYEEYYYSADRYSAFETTQNLRSLKNIKTNYFYIMSSAQDQDKSIIKYYRELKENNPASGKAAFYLGLSYLKHSDTENMIDSTYVLFSEAEDLGLEGKYFGLAKLELFQKLDLRSEAVKLADTILNDYPNDPLVASYSAGIYSDFCKDHSYSEKLYRKALSFYPDLIDAYVGLSSVYFKRNNYSKASVLIDSALNINKDYLSAVKTALKIDKSTQNYKHARKVLEGLTGNYTYKYIENTKISLLEGNPSKALDIINNAVDAYPDNNALSQMNRMVFKIISLSDVIQQNESSLSMGSINWIRNWESAVQISERTKKPLMVVAIDNENLASKYMENVLSSKDIVKLMNNTAPIKLNKYKDRILLDSLGINDFPAVIYTNKKKHIIRDFFNKVGNITETEVLNSFLKECIYISKRKALLELQSGPDKLKTAKDFSHAEELALEFELPIMVVATSEASPHSEQFLKQTVFHPDFLENLNNMILVTVEEAQNRDFFRKFKIKKFPTVLFFDENINLISSKYGVIPRAILTDIITEIKLFRKRKDIVKEKVNWIYDLEEAKEYSGIDNKPILAYYSTDNDSYSYPRNMLFKDHEVIKTLNSRFIPLLLDEPDILHEEGIKYQPAVSVLNRYGKLIYGSEVNDKDYFLMNFLDHKSNFDTYVSMGKDGFREFIEGNNRISVFVRNNMNISAENEILTSLVRHPTNAYIIYQLSSMLMNSNMLSDAKHYLKFLDDVDFILTDNYLKLLVSTYMMYDDFNNLDAVLNDYLKKFKNNKSALSAVNSALSEIYFAESKTIDAISYAHKAFSLAPKRADNSILLGLLYFNIDQTNSEKYFRTALIIDRTNPVAFAHLSKMKNNERYAVLAKQSFYNGKDDLSGLRYFDKDKFFDNKGIVELRERSLRFKIDLFPDNLDYKNDLARFITETNGDMAEALEISNKILEESPDDPEYLDTAAWVFYSLGDYSVADKLVSKALRNLSPQEYSLHTDLFYHIGKIKSEIGDNRSAQFYFEKFITFNKNANLDFDKVNYARTFVDNIR